MKGGSKIAVQCNRVQLYEQRAAWQKRRLLGACHLWLGAGGAWTLVFGCRLLWFQDCDATKFSSFIRSLKKIFFLTWTIFKVFIESVTILLLFYVLVFWPWGMWDLSFLTRNWTWTCCIRRQNPNHWTTRVVLTCFKSKILALLTFKIMVELLNAV